MRVLAVLALVAAAGAAEDLVKADRQRLQGTWRVVSVEAGGEDFSEKLTPKCLFIFRGDIVVLQDSSKAPECQFTLDPSKKPRWIDISFKGEKESLPGIYEFDGKYLRICYSFPGEKRPESFRTRTGQKAISFRLKRPDDGDANRRLLLDAAAEKADALFKEGKWAEAVPAFEKAVALSLDVNGPDHPRTGSLMSGLAEVYRQTGEYLKAEPLFTRALEVARRDLGEENPVVGDLTNNLALVCQHLGDFERAERLLRHSLEISEKTHGLRAASTGISLINLGELCRQAGLFTEAEKHFRRALTIFEGKFGPDHPRTALALNALGLLDRSVGRHDEAEELYRRALKAFTDGPGASALEAAKVRSNLGTLLLELGQYPRALGLLQDSVKELERHGRQEPIALAAALNNLGIVLIQLHRNDEAAPIFERAIRLLEEAAGKKSLLLGKMLNNQAAVYFRRGELAPAMTRWQRCREILEATEGPDHPDLALNLVSLAFGHLLQSEFDEASKLYDRAIAIMERAPGGEDNLFYGRVLLERAFFRALRHDEKAWESMQKGMDAEQRLLRRVFRFSSEAAMRDYLGTLGIGLPLAVSLSGQEGAPATARSDALTWVLRRKTVILDTLCRYRALEQAVSRDPDVAALVRQRTLLEQRWLSLATRQGPGHLAEQLAVARRERDEVEAALFRALSAKAPEAVGDAEADTAHVRARLPAGSALVEVVRADKFDLRAASTIELGEAAHYFAFVLHPGEAPPQLIDLGAAEAIDEVVKKISEHMERTAFEYRYGALDEHQREGEYQELARDLSKKVFAPLQDALKPATRLYLALDGNLNRVPWEALVGADGKYLAETYRFVYLSSGSDLLQPRGKLAHGTTVFAGPNYNLEPAARREKLRNLDIHPPLPSAKSVVAVGPQVRAAEGGTWKPLAGAGEEAGILRDIFKDSRRFGPVAVFEGDTALEEVLLSRPAPRLLHLATHGFFYPEPPEEQRGKFGPLGHGIEGLGGRLKHLDDPLLRSGIVLAGANLAGKTAASEGVEDGWVTAAEIALLDLRRTDLVVLSACQTGLGDIRAGEGVSGLRRAFQYAGARTVVLTLFTVPDHETRDLIKAFYKKLEAGRSKLDALHDAQRQVIERRRANRNSDEPDRPGAAHPFFWAGFILIGDPD
jgi:uncharacterized protein (TIGR03067 family)